MTQGKGDLNGNDARLSFVGIAGGFFDANGRNIDHLDLNCTESNSETSSVFSRSAASIIPNDPNASQAWFIDSSHFIRCNQRVAVVLVGYTLLVVIANGRHIEGHLHLVLVGPLSVPVTVTLVIVV